MHVGIVIGTMLVLLMLAGCGGSAGPKQAVAQTHQVMVADESNVFAPQDLTISAGGAGPARKRRENSAVHSGCCQRHSGRDR